MEGPLGEEPPQKLPVLSRLLQRSKALTSRITLMNVLHRVERGLRPALGSALIMALTMCDIPNMDYSFKYVGPFLFLVISSLAPPFVSTSVLLLAAGLFCVLLATALATGLIACLLLDTGAQAVCIVAYVLSLSWVSFLSFGKTKELTLIGSYILLYTVPLATLIASRYALNGLSITLTPEKTAWIRNYLNTHSQEELIADASHFFLVDAEVLRSILNYLSSTEFKMKIHEAFKNFVGSILADLKGDPQQTLNKILEALRSLQQHKDIDIQFHIDEDISLASQYKWLYDVPFFIESSTEHRLTFGAKKGVWILEALWSSSPVIGLLRNIVIFAALGYAVYVLLSFIPPIRRQRDVAIRDMAHTCTILSKYLGTSRNAIKSDSPISHRAEDVAVPSNFSQPNGAPIDQTPLEAFGVEIQESVLTIVSDSKAVLLSAMEPSVVYPGLGVFASKELECARVGLLQCCWTVQSLHRMLERDGSGEGFFQLATHFPEVNKLFSKSSELFELCRELLWMSPRISNRHEREKKARSLIDEMRTAEQELEEAASAIISRCSIWTKKYQADSALNLDTRDDVDRGPEGSCGNIADISRSSDNVENAVAKSRSISASSGVPGMLCPSETDQPSIPSNGISAMQTFVLLASALCAEPVSFSRKVRGFHVARTRSTWRGFLMNVLFPLAPLAVHVERLTVAPVKALLLWRHQWRGANAWWRDPEVWYALKLIAPMSCIFACGICFPKFLDYSWGVKVTDSPIILDATDQGVSTRMVPWFMLGYLTVLQVTCNGTVFRGMNRLLGILFGSLSGWVAMELCGESLPALITYCSATVFLDVFFLCNSHHPLDGFHLKWGYAGQVFTYTQVLVVCLAYGNYGGLTGQPKYLATTRILSNSLGIILAILVSHIPPISSATWSACKKFREVLSLCSNSFMASVLSFEALCHNYKPYDSVSVQISPPRISEMSSSSHAEGTCDSVARAINVIDTIGKDSMGSAFRYIREACWIPRPLPWHTNGVLEDFHCIIGSVLASVRDALLFIDELRKETGTQERAETELVNVASKSEGNDELKRDKVTFKEYISAEPVVEDQALDGEFHALWLRRDRVAGLRELFFDPSGLQLAQSVRELIEAFCILFETVGVGISLVPRKLWKMPLIKKASYAAQTDSITPYQAYETGKVSVEQKRMQVEALLSNRLGGSTCVDSRIKEGAMTLMALLSRLDILKDNLDALHSESRGRGAS